MYKHIMLSSIFLLIGLTGCVQQQKIKPDIYRQHQEVIAKFADLPDAPFQAQLKTIVTSPEYHDQVQVFYTSCMPKIDMMHFYEQQMERLGWQLIAQSDIQDCLLQYSKPEQFCTIVISQDRFSLYFGNKKGA